MKFIVQSRAIKKQLFLSDIIPTKSSTPIILYIEIIADTGVKLLATDDERMLSVSVDADVVETGSIAVKGKEFAALIESFPDTQLTIYSEPDTAESLVIATSTSEFRLPAKNEHLPQFSYTGFNTKIIANGLDIQKSIKSVEWAASELISDTAMNGINIRSNNNNTLVFTATNRYKIVRTKIDASVENKFNITLPKKTAKSVGDILNTTQPCVVHVGDCIKVEVGNSVLFGKLISEEFPDCTPIFAAKKNISFTCKKREILSSAQRISLLLKEKVPVINFAVSKDEMVLSAQESNTRAREIVPVTYDGNDMQFAVNCDFLIEGINALSNETVQFSCNEQLSMFSLTSLDSENKPEKTEIVIATIRR